MNKWNNSKYGPIGGYDGTAVRNIEQSSQRSSLIKKTKQKLLVTIGLGELNKLNGFQQQQILSLPIRQFPIMLDFIKHLDCIIGLKTEDRNTVIYNFIQILKRPSTQNMGLKHILEQLNPSEFQGIQYKIINQIWNAEEIIDRDKVLKEQRKELKVKVLLELLLPDEINDNSKTILITGDPNREINKLTQGDIEKIDKIIEAIENNERLLQELRNHAFTIIAHPKFGIGGYDLSSNQINQIYEMIQEKIQPPRLSINGENRNFKSEIYSNSNTKPPYKPLIIHPELQEENKELPELFGGQAKNQQARSQILQQVPVTTDKASQPEELKLVSTEPPSKKHSGIKVEVQKVPTGPISKKVPVIKQTGPASKKNVKVTVTERRENFQKSLREGIEQNNSEGVKIVHPIAKKTVEVTIKSYRKEEPIEVIPRRSEGYSK